MTPRNYEPLQQIVQSFAVPVTSKASAPPTRQLLEDEQINFNIGGTLAFLYALEALSALALVSSRFHLLLFFLEANLAYKKKGEESNAVIEPFREFYLATVSCLLWNTSA